VSVSRAEPKGGASAARGIRLSVKISEAYLVLPVVALVMYWPHMGLVESAKLCDNAEDFL
jgi:hypothetical protein